MCHCCCCCCGCCCCYRCCCCYWGQQASPESSLTPSNPEVTFSCSESSGAGVITIGTDAKGRCYCSCLHDISSREEGGASGDTGGTPLTRLVAMVTSDDTATDAEEGDDKEVTATQKVKVASTVIILTRSQTSLCWCSSWPSSHCTTLIQSAQHSLVFLARPFRLLLSWLVPPPRSCLKSLTGVDPPRSAPSCDKGGTWQWSNLEPRQTIIIPYLLLACKCLKQNCETQPNDASIHLGRSCERQVIQTTARGNVNCRRNVSIQARKQSVKRSCIRKDNSFVFLKYFIPQLWIFLFVLLGQTLLTLTPFCSSAPTNLNLKPGREVHSSPAETNGPGLSEITVKELRKHTPDYIFRLHNRHETEWQDFRQFDPDHIKHPGHFEEVIRQRAAETTSQKRDPLGLSESEKSFVLQRIYGNSGRLGTVTAIRHHRHVATHDVELGRSRRSVPDSSEYPKRRMDNVQEHRMIFRLAEMPDNEELLAASLRLRYAPRQMTGVLEQSFVKTISAHCRLFTADRHQWPISIWMHYEDVDLGTNQMPAVDVKAMATFEPDRSVCRLMRNSANATLLHLPPGWFNIPLNPSVIGLLRQTEGASHKAGRYISIRIRSSNHQPETGLSSVLLREDKLANSLSKPVVKRDWLQEAPHLFTFHRDPELMNHLRRQKRSSTLGDKNYLNMMPNDKESHRHSQLKTPKTVKQKKRQGRSSLRPHAKRRRRAVIEASSWRKNSGGGAAYAPSRYSQSSYSGMASASRPMDSVRPSVHYQATMDTGGARGLDIAYLETTCQRRDLLIDFDAIGWGGWVIAPQVYNARYCHGQCPFPLSTHYNTTNHAVLLQLVHLLDAASIAGPCCVSDRLSSQSLLYHSQSGDVVLRVYQDMVVESCACR